MNSPTGTGDFTLDLNGGMGWVNEHGAHLLDYASYHLDPDRAVAAVAVALRTCSRQTAPGNVTDRARLLAVVRRECAAGGDRGREFRPGPGPGTPDDEAVRRAWTVVDPLGAETLRLLYRHELSPQDLSYVLALPVREIGRLIARTQDMVEILVSGLDGLARGRPICPDIAPLAAAVFPASVTGELVTAELPPAARSELLRHIVTCLICKKPINIRYTVPQILSRPPVSALAPEVRSRLTEALARTDAVPQVDAALAHHGDKPSPPSLPAPRPPASFGMPLAAPVSADPAPSAPAVPDLPAVPAGREDQGTPLYDALLSQIRARTAEARFGEATAPAAAPGTRPAHDPVPAAEPAREPALDRNGITEGHTARTARHALPRDREPGAGSGPEFRLLDVIVRVWAMIRATAIRIVIVVIAGAAGTVAGINLLAPAQPRSSTVEATAGEATAVQTAAALPTSSPVTMSSGAAGTGAAEPEPVSVDGLRIPSVVELDDFGRGDITLTSTSDKAVKWRIAAPGLIVKPSKGTLRPGQRDVIRLRALQVRYWCGPPPPVTAQLVLHGPSDSGTATVRWRSC